METKNGVAIPILEEEEKRFIGQFSRLSQEEIRGILNIIINEVTKSYESDGLVIGEKDLFLEEWYFLCTLHQDGGIEKIKKDDIKTTETYLKESFETFFRNFKLGSKMKSEVEEEMNQLKYQEHLEVVEKAIIDAIYGNKI